MYKIALIGTGAVGSVLSRFLSADPEIENIACFSNNETLAKQFIDLSDRKISFSLLDASDTEQIKKATAGADFVVNASLPRFNLNIMEASLHNGSNYLDLASELSDLKNAEQLRFNDNFRKSGLVGLINAGVAPGITNLFAREGSEQMDEVESIKLRCFEEQISSDFIYSWSPETTIDDITAPPLVYRNGEFSLTKVFGDSEDFEFPKPIGKRRAYNLYGDEVATLPLYIKVKNVDFKSAGSDIEESRKIVSDGQDDREKILSDLKGHGGTPTPREVINMLSRRAIDHAQFALSSEIRGKIKGIEKIIKISAIFPDIYKINELCPGATYISYPTGLSAYLFVKAAFASEIKGVYPPENLNSRERSSVLSGLEQNGINIIYGT